MLVESWLHRLSLSLPVKVYGDIFCFQNILDDGRHLGHDSGVFKVTCDVIFVRSLPLARTSGFTKSTLEQHNNDYYSYETYALTSNEGCIIEMIFNYLQKQTSNQPWSTVNRHGRGTIERAFTPKVLCRNIFEHRSGPLKHKILPCQLIFMNIRYT